jgi:hypothetical protein
MEMRSASIEAHPSAPARLEGYKKSVRALKQTCRDGSKNLLANTNCSMIQKLKWHASPCGQQPCQGELDDAFKSKAKCNITKPAGE